MPNMDRYEMVLRALAVEVAFQTLSEMKAKWNGAEDRMVISTDVLNIYANEDPRYPEGFLWEFEAEENPNDRAFLFSAPVNRYPNARALAEAFVQSQRVVAHV